MKDAIEAYFGKAAPVARKGNARPARADGKYTINADQLRRHRSCRRCMNFFAVRDAALTEAGERAGAARDAA